MASSSFTTSSSSSAASSPLPPITTDEFNLFHSIDRTLYSCLILTLGRDPAQSMQVMALWLWLERTGRGPLLVKRILSLPTAFVNALADESLSCLKCAETDRLINFDTIAGNVDTGTTNIPLLQSVVGPDLSLQFFHENRIGVLRGVKRIVNEVCARAFEDILRNAFGSSNSFFAGGPRDHDRVVAVVPFNPEIGVGYEVGPAVVAGEGFVGGGEVGDQYRRSVAELSLRAYDPYDLTVQRQFLSDELGDLLGRLSLQALTDEEEIREVPPDDRTIFLTFSKGYPISENELRDFFTRKYGDFIEAIYMQEVGADEQVLYARLVARSASVIHSVLEGQNKAKFSINGKHAWARKYVRKLNPKSPPQPTSPVNAAPPKP